MHGGLAFPKMLVTKQPGVKHPGPRAGQDPSLLQKMDVYVF